MLNTILDIYIKNYILQKTYKIYLSNKLLVMMFIKISNNLMLYLMYKLANLCFKIMNSLNFYKHLINQKNINQVFYQLI